MKRCSFAVGLTSLVVVTILLGGCATTPVRSSEATPVASSRHLAFKQSGPNTAPVLVIRDSGMNTGACNSKLTIDGQIAAYIGTSEKVLLHIPAGEVIIGVEASGICAGGLQERQVVLSPGKPAYFRIGYDTSGALGIHPTIAR